MANFKLSIRELQRMVDSIDDDAGMLLKESTLKYFIETQVNKQLGYAIPALDAALDLLVKLLAEIGFSPGIEAEINRAGMKIMAVYYEMNRDHWDQANPVVDVRSTKCENQNQSTSN